MERELKRAKGFLSEPVWDGDHSIGSAGAPITIVEYGDYECPTCQNALPVVQRLQERLGDRLRFVFRHFPRNSIHPNASAAAEAAEAAAEQGKFWEMHEALFRHQQELGSLDLSHLALNLGLEIYRFEQSRTTDKHRQRIAKDYEGGLRSGVEATPTFFINGRRYEGAIEADAMVAAAETT